jgi:hypothetical protein
MGQLAPFFAAIGAAAATAAPYIAAAGAGISAIGSIQQGNQAYASAKSEQYAREANAQLLQFNAQAAGQQAVAREALLRRRVAATQGEARAALGSTGTAATGSNLGLLEQAAQEGELDALTIRYEGEMQQRGLMAQAQQELYQAQGAKRQAKDARRAGFMNAATSLLSGAAMYGAGGFGGGGMSAGAWTRKPGMFTNTGKLLNTWSGSTSGLSAARY